jgi:hypothetical protein
MKLIQLTLLIAVLLAGCSGDPHPPTSAAADSPPLTVADLRIPQPLTGMRMGAGYLTLANNSAQDIRITHVVSPELESVEMHESILDDGVSRMKKLPEVVVPAGKTLVFEPGAKHLMLRYPESIPSNVTLRFFSGEDLLLSVVISITRD